MKSLVCWTCSVAVVIGSAVALAGDARADDPSSSGGVKLERLKWDAFKKRLANPKAKYTIVDAWATTCGPCKKNFPHLVEMHKKYGGKGLSVVSLSLDDPEDKTAVAEALAFLKEKQATFTNVLLDENFGDGFDKLEISAIPAVFIFGPDGKEVKRFTMDDPKNQFTYDQVEKAVASLLDAR